MVFNISKYYLMFILIAIALQEIIGNFDNHTYFKTHFLRKLFEFYKVICSLDDPREFLDGGRSRITWKNSLDGVLKIYLIFPHLPRYYE